MNLGQVKTICRTALGRGATLDAQLQLMVQESVQQLENMRPWQYMFKESRLTYNPNATDPRKLKILSGNIRNIDYVRNPERTKYWQQIFPTQVSGAQFADENAYWIEEDDTLVWAYDFADTQLFDVGFFQYSTVSDDDAFTNWLFKRGGSVIIGKTLVQMSDLVRNSQIAQTYIANLAMNEALLRQADEDMKFGNMKLAMRS